MNSFCSQTFPDIITNFSGRRAVIILLDEFEIEFKRSLRTKMVNGKWLSDIIERLKASAWHQLFLPLLPFTHARSESINADSLKLQLLTARKKEWWPATADSLPQAVYLTTVKHTALVGIEPTTFRS